MSTHSETSQDPTARAMRETAIAMDLYDETTKRFHDQPINAIECAVAMLAANILAQDAAGDAAVAFARLFDLERLVKQLLPIHCAEVRHNIAQAGRAETPS